MSASSIARAFWLSNFKQPLFGLYYINRAFEILGSYSPDEIELADEALETDLQQQGINTDLNSLTVELGTLKAESFEFWAGKYLLQAETGEEFRLYIVDDTVQLLSSDLSKLLEQPYGKIPLQNQNLTFEDKNLKLNLTFFFPTDLQENADVSISDIVGKDGARVKGQIERKGSQSKKYILTGKRDVCTVAGLNSEYYGDPPEVWFGHYVSRYTDGDFAYLEDIVVGTASDGTVIVSYGGVPASSVVLSNNVLVFMLSTGAWLAVNLLCSSTGLRTLRGIVNANGFNRPVVGTARTLYALAPQTPFDAPLASGVADTPAFCTTQYDQKATIGSLGMPVRPSQQANLPVTYADGTQGTIQIAPASTVGTDIYSVPPGRLVAYHGLDANNQPLSTDASLMVGWRVTQPLTLLEMIESNYYQMRLSFTDWRSCDNNGMTIALAQDDPTVRSFITLTQAISPICPAGSGGSGSSIADFTKATTLISANSAASGTATREYLLQLSSKSSVSDNSAQSHNGFLYATLSFLDQNGANKLPAQTVLIPMLISIELPINIAPPLIVTGADTVPSAYSGQTYSATLTASGGKTPYQWNVVTAPLSGLNWATGGDASFVLSGTVDSSTVLGTYTTAVAVQSDTNSNSVSQPMKVNVSLTVAPTWELIAGATLASVAIFVCAVGGIYYSISRANSLKGDMNKLKNRSANQNAMQDNIEKTNTLNIDIKNDANIEMTDIVSNGKYYIQKIENQQESSNRVSSIFYQNADNTEMALQKAKESGDIEQADQLKNELDAIHNVLEDLDNRKVDIDNSGDYVKASFDYER